MEKKKKVSAVQFSQVLQKWLAPTQTISDV